jgi:hypothetical protein
MENVPFTQNLENLDQRIADELAERKRFTITDSQVDELIKVVTTIETKKGSPATWLEVRQALLTDDYPLLHDVRESPFLKAAFFWSDKVYMTNDCNYTSMIKWNDNYMTYRERFQAKYGN